MAVRPESRWWIVLLVLVGLLLGISALALNRPDVVWSGAQPHCPHCRRTVEPFGTRCPTCREEYDWAVAPDEDSPISRWSLSPLEERHLRARIALLGKDAAQERVARALELSPAAAAAYLERVGSGRCGWCGGTGRDLGAGSDAKDAGCPACFGAGACIACGGDHRVRLGDATAARDMERYLQAVAALGPGVDPEEQRAEVRSLGRAFLGAHTGTAEAARILFAPLWAPDRPVRTVEACRSRLDAVLQALAAPPAPPAK